MAMELDGPSLEELENSTLDQWVRWVPGVGWRPISKYELTQAMKMMGGGS